MKKKSVKYLLHFMLLCMPLILLLIACIFPTKQINNTYALEETTTTETETTINFNQLFNLNYPSSVQSTTINGITFSVKNNRVIASGTCTNSYNFETGYINLLQDNYYILSNYYNNMPISNNDYASIQLYRVGGPYYGIQENMSNNAVKFKCTTTDNYVVRFRFQENYTYNFDYYANLFNLTKMNLETISINDFFNLFPLKQYVYNEEQEITLSSLTITNNIGNQAEQPLQVNETKQPNEAILMPYKSFYSLEVNNWYRSLLELIGVDISSTDLVQGYLLYFPLWAMWFWLFELIELAVTLVPKLVYEIYTKLSRSKDE